jgi:ADP-heptose:LPS heptosyltransferase
MSCMRVRMVVAPTRSVMHMAVAFNRPLVALFGPTDITHAGPYRRPQDVITHKRPDEHVRHRDVDKASEFMRRITVDEVIAACKERLATETLSHREEEHQ